MMGVYYTGPDGLLYRKCDGICDTCPDYCFSNKPATTLNDEDEEDEEDDEDADDGEYDLSDEAEEWASQAAWATRYQNDWGNDA